MSKVLRRNQVNNEHLRTGRTHALTLSWMCHGVTQWTTNGNSKPPEPRVAAEGQHPVSTPSET